MYKDFAYIYDKLSFDLDYEKYANNIKNLVVQNNIKKEKMLELACGFRVIIVIEANSYVNIRSSRLLPNFKTQKINSWCAA